MDGPAPVLLADEPADLAGGRPGRRQLALDLADMHGLGWPQLFVTSMVNDRLDSYVLVWRAGAWQRVAEHQPYYFRVLTPPGRSPMLLGQRRSLSEPFYGGVARLEWAGDAYEERGTIALPPAATIYDFALADLDRDGQDEIVYLDEHDRLVALGPDGRRLGASEESFGGVASYIDYLPSGIVQSAGQLPVRVRLSGRMVVEDLDGDGTLEVVVPKNVSLTKMIERIKGYRYGQIYALGWDGQRFVQKWAIPRIEGIIADIGVARLLGGNGGSQVLVLANPTFQDKLFKELFTSSSQLLMYTVPQG
jgi:hypothetical protein